MAEPDAVWHVEADLVRVTDTDLQPVTERVKGWVVGMGVTDLVILTDTLRVCEIVGVRVKGWVVAMPVAEPVWHVDGDLVKVCEAVVQPLTDLVASWVVAKGDPVRVTQVEGERVIVTETVIEGETVYVALLLDAAGVPESVTLKDPVREPVAQYVVLTVVVRVFGFVVITGEAVPHRVGLPETVGDTIPLLVA